MAWSADGIILTPPGDNPTTFQHWRLSLAGMNNAALSCWGKRLREIS